MKRSISVFLMLLATTATMSQQFKKEMAELKKNSTSIAGIFIKQNGKPGRTAAPVSKSLSGNGTVSPLTGNAGKNSATALNPGDIAPGAVYIDADAMEPFNGGAAVIRRGQSSALINSRGEIIVPYNKYSFHTYARTDVITHIGGGFFMANDPQGKQLVINAKGQVVGIGAGISDCGNYAIVRQDPAKVNSKLIYIDSSNRKYISDYGVSYIENGFGKAYTDANSYFFHSIFTNKSILSSSYKSAGDSFSEGLALVMKTDSYGIAKYGFIDTSGKIVIPIMYTNQPTAFRNGLSKVIPANNPNIMYAYINKAGKIVIQHSPEDVRKNGTFEEFTLGWAGLESGKRMVMDTTGKIWSKTEFNKIYNIPEEAMLIGEDKMGRLGIFNDGKFRFSRRAKASDPDRFNTAGFTDITTKKCSGYAFHYVEYRSTLRFDKVSKLAYAERWTGNDINGSPLYRKGYINDDGLFVIVMREKGEW